MAKTIPPYGDQYLGDNPWALRADEIIMYVTGRNASGILYGTDVDSDDVTIAASSAAQTLTLWTVPAGTFVEAIWANTADSWGANSDAANFTVGDTASADTWFTDTLLGPAATDADNVLKIGTAGTGGKFYDTGATILVTAPLTTTAGLTTGLTKFIMLYSMAR